MLNENYTSNMNSTLSDVDSMNHTDFVNNLTLNIKFQHCTYYSLGESRC